MTKNDKKFYVLSHSHWDREWYLSHAKHNFNLVQFMDKLIEVLETDAEFKSFHLDGQIIVLEDYSKVRPSMGTVPLPISAQSMSKPFKI